MTDPLLDKIDDEEKASLEIESYADIGMQELNLSEEKIDLIVSLIHQMGIQDEDFAKDVKTVVMGSMFALGSRGVNEAWKEHFSIIREICREWSSHSATIRRVKEVMEIQNLEFHLGQDDAQEISQLCNDISNYNSFFCGAVHHENDKMIRSWRMIVGDEEPRQKVFEDKEFIKVAQSMFEDLLDLQEIIADHESN